MADRNWRVGVMAIIASTLVAGCLPEIEEPKVRAPAEAPANAAPNISGVPPTSATAGSAWRFQPNANDADGDTLTFSATGLPGWIRIDSSSGALSGTPDEKDVGTSAAIVVTVSDGRARASLPRFSVVVKPAAAVNRPPAISGIPATSVNVGSFYRFTPTATDADGDALTWSISGKPPGATFSPVTGELTWTPASSGTWTNIMITVTDSGNASASLPAFSITVTPSPQARSATLSWTPPTQYTDGKMLPASELAAYHIYRGSSAANLARIAEVDGNATTYTVQELPSGTHYFAVTAVSALGAESAFSAVGSKSIQ